MASLRLACNGSRREADGNYTERPNYFDVSVFGAVADTVERYVRKGRRVAVDGRLEWREWETADLQKRQAVSVVADTIQFLDGPGDSPGDGEDGDGERDGSQSGDERELVGAGVSGDDGDLAF